MTKLGSQFGISTRSLTRRFLSGTGQGPQAYLRHARILHARRFLETTSQPIDEIRRAVGYEDPASFRRTFKRTTGLSPNDYRHAYGPRRA